MTNKWRQDEGQGCSTVRSIHSPHTQPGSRHMFLFTRGRLWTGVAFRIAWGFFFAFEEKEFFINKWGWFGIVGGGLLSKVCCWRPTGRFHPLIVLVSMCFSQPQLVLLVCVGIAAKYEEIPQNQPYAQDAPARDWLHTFVRLKEVPRQVHRFNIPPF